LQVLHEERDVVFKLSTELAYGELVDDICTSPAPLLVAPQILKLRTAPTSAIEPPVTSTLEPPLTVDGTL
jgi:hypothetical protein